MQSTNSILIYRGQPLTALEGLTNALNLRLGGLEVVLDSGAARQSGAAIFTNSQWRITIEAFSKPLATEKFHGTMDSVLSQSSLSDLARISKAHKSHVQISVQPVSQQATPVTWLQTLRVAHAVTSVAAEAAQPDAVLWPSSNQLLTGVQYLELAADPTPWPLFVRTEQVAPTAPGRISLEIDNAADFIGRPILFPDTEFSLDLAYAAALAFLRHAVENGSAIPDGHSFGPEDGYVVKVTHATATKAQPLGSYVLRSTPSRSKHPIAQPKPGDGVILDQTRERTRSLAISYLMLVLLPPVGLVLLFSNALLRPSAGRTGLVAMSALAILMVIGAYTFLNIEVENTAAVNLQGAADILNLND